MKKKLSIATIFGIIIISVLGLVVFTGITLKHPKQENHQKEVIEEVGCNNKEIISQLLVKLINSSPTIKEAEFIRADSRKLERDGRILYQCMGYFKIINKEGYSTVVKFGYNILNFKTMEEKRRFMEELNKTQKGGSNLNGFI